MGEQKQTQEEVFLSGLEASAAILERLVSVTENVVEAIEMIKVALVNDGQLKLLLRLMTENRGK